jgi:hypothetical protein
MTSPTQASLFGDGELTLPQRASTPDLTDIRRRFETLFTTLRSAKAMPFSEREARMWTIVVPNMSKWLPDAEAEAICAAFSREMERLGGAISR